MDDKENAEISQGQDQRAAKTETCSVHTAELKDYAQVVDIVYAAEEEFTPEQCRKLLRKVDLDLATVQCCRPHQKISHRNCHMRRLLRRQLHRCPSFPRERCPQIHPCHRGMFGYVCLGVPSDAVFLAAMFRDGSPAGAPIELYCTGG